ncbi:hypothetical protein HG535_0C03540 [Zygotorulaspora mrakii]|uniref:UBX domain-containing protein n=1 Tax=Zygotorulaspora mrakii TaxID=42260 RepID=A0A7H9B054_ZYGMR|nr:uncharacterized protein HG535_0C03540 [Zygotorulaspora mrakii]QLG72001.1 hypothetical protein HG535_0C03540 [Zygotorulaspora mrakii]
MSQEQLDNFVAITSAENEDLAKHFIEMAGGDLETAIALFFEHGGNSQLTGHNSSNSLNRETSATANVNNDEQMAQRLQGEAYQEDEDMVRPPDEARHETLVDTHVFPGAYGGIGGRFEPLRRARDMFDESRPAGIFNQRLDDDYMDDNSSTTGSEYGSSNEDDGAYEYVEEPVIELDEDGNATEFTKLVRKPKLLSKEERLALLFRPPFDIMSKVNLDGAKAKARRKNKWIMINIQDAGIFQCQALNRDLWSSKQVKKLIKPNFVFLQYQYDSRNAESYINFYGLHRKDDLPHIAILDPITGERLKQWNRTVPTPQSFMDGVNEFLQNFSLDPTASNPTVKEPTPEIDPTTLTEEQQMELAINQSLGKEPNIQSPHDEQHTEAQNIQEQAQEQVPKQEQMDEFDSIKPIKHVEPSNKPGITTRIQIRTGDGKRIVKRFNTDDNVRKIYEMVKAELDGFDSCRFSLSNHRRDDLIEKLNVTIEDAGLKNSSLLLEKIDSQED